LFCAIVAMIKPSIILIQLIKAKNRAKRHIANTKQIGNHIELFNRNYVEFERRLENERND
jgi:hypothetical protein